MRSCLTLGTSSQNSRIRALGIVAMAFIVAAVAIGPLGLCGATDTYWVSAMAAICVSALIPPVWQTSGWIMSTALWFKSSMNLVLVTILSPVAIGTGDFDLT